jgi:hypothetical protein
MNLINKQMQKLHKLKFHYKYARAYGDTDIQTTYFNKIKYYFAEEIFGEFGYDTCHDSEKDFILTNVFKLLNDE